MRSASYQLSSNRGGDQPRSRAVSLAITIALHVLALILLLRFAPQPPDRLPRPVSLQLMPDAQETATSNPRTRTVTQVKHASGGAARRGPEPPATPKAQPPATPPATAQPSLSLLPIDLASSDISKMPSHASEHDAGGASDDSGAGKDSGSAYGPSDGPNGERLYNADWYTRPTNAQLQTYIPSSAPRTGWGVIACKTAPRFLVEDCHILGESPAGSGFGRAVLNASWQFRVLPPRIGGRAMVGTWVQIRIDYLEGNAAAR